MRAKDELDELIDELAQDDPEIRSRVAAAAERRELARENEHYARPENQQPQGPPRRRRRPRT